LREKIMTAQPPTGGKLAGFLRRRRTERGAKSREKWNAERARWSRLAASFQLVNRN